jgi:hypothetical protein
MRQWSKRRAIGRSMANSWVWPHGALPDMVDRSEDLEMAVDAAETVRLAPGTEHFLVLVKQFPRHGRQNTLLTERRDIKVAEAARAAPFSPIVVEHALKVGGDESWCFKTFQ